MATRFPAYRDNAVKPIPLADLDISELNVRRREITADLDDLIQSLDRFGLQQPIVVMPKGDRFSIVTGQRRYLAAKHLGWDEIHALVLAEPLDDVDATIISFSENIQRRELSAQDKADACSFLMERLGSVREVAKELGISQPDSPQVARLCRRSRCCQRTRTTSRAYGGTSYPNCQYHRGRANRCYRCPAFGK